MGNDDVEALLEAAAKLRAESEQAERALGKTPSTSTTSTTPPPPASLTYSEALNRLSTLDLTSPGALSVLPSYNNPPTPLTPFPTNLKTLESRTSGAVTGDTLGVGGGDDVSLDDFKYATIAVTVVSTILAIASGFALPNNTGATLTYLFAVVPILWIGVGSSAPGILAGLIETVRSSEEDAKVKRGRVISHEAAHLICGYVCGLNIVKYEVEDGEPRVEFGLPVGRDIPFDTVSKVAVVAMAGSVGEIAGGYEKAKGGENDLLLLQDVMSGCEEFLGAARQQDLTRWGALTSWNIVKGKKGVFDDVRKGMEEGKDLKELIATIEGAGK